MTTPAKKIRRSGSPKSKFARPTSPHKTRTTDLQAKLLREWLTKSALEVANDEQQQQLHAALAPLIGAFSSGKSRRSESASEIVRKRLTRKYGR